MGLILFDPIGTLGCLVSRDANQSSGRLIDRYAQVDKLLDSLREKHTLGILAQRSRLSGVDDAVAAIDLGSSFDRLFFDSHGSIDAGVLRDLVDTHTQVAFVSASSAFRAAVGPHVSATAPHAALANAALELGDLVFFRALLREDASWIARAKELSIVPVLLDRGVVFGIGSKAALSKLSTCVETMETPGNEDSVTTGDLAAVRFCDDSREDTLAYRSKLKELPIAWMNDEEARAIAVFRFDQNLADWVPPRAPHGHRVALAPQRILFEEASSPFPDIQRPISFPSDFIDQLNEVNESRIESFLGPLCYGHCLPDGVAVPRHALISRDVSHIDNRRAVELLRFQLSQILSPDDVWLHWFRTLSNGPGNDLLPNVIGSLPGSVDDKRVVVLGAHLDSTSDRPTGSKVALGADDDASGVAAVLAAATLHANYSAAGNWPRATIFYALFNSEERGMLGSQAFAGDLKTAGYEVIAMIQADMVGWNGEDQFSAWCGHSSPSSSRTLAELIVDSTKPPLREGREARLAWILGKNLKAQIKQGPADGGEPDSDHLAFRSRHWPAVLVTESTVARGRKNPAYHSARDAIVDSEYAAAIARTLSAVSWMLADREPNQ